MSFYSCVLFLHIISFHCSDRIAEVSLRWDSVFGQSHRYIRSNIQRWLERCKSVQNWSVVREGSGHHSGKQQSSEYQFKFQKCQRLRTQQSAHDKSCVSWMHLGLFSTQWRHTTCSPIQFFPFEQRLRKRSSHLEIRNQCKNQTIIADRCVQSEWKCHHSTS